MRRRFTLLSAKIHLVENSRLRAGLRKLSILCASFILMEMRLPRIENRVGLGGKNG